MPYITFRVTEQLFVELEEKVHSSRYKNRSELLRDLCRRYVDGLLIPVKVTEYKVRQ